jgi:hypothetical protein
MENPEPSWVNSLRNLSKYGLQICVYEDWKYLFIIGVKNGTMPRPDVYTFTPITCVLDFRVYEDSSDEEKKLLYLIISFLVKLDIHPCREQYEQH